MIIDGVCYRHTAARSIKNEKLRMKNDD
jgi:hypothetical protein